MYKDKDAISSRRPLAYAEHYEAEVRRNSSVVTADAQAAAYRAKVLEKVNVEGSYDHDEKV